MVFGRIGLGFVLVDFYLSFRFILGLFLGVFLWYWSGVGIGCLDFSFCFVWLVLVGFGWF